MHYVVEETPILCRRLTLDKKDMSVIIFAICMDSPGVAVVVVV